MEITLPRGEVVLSEPYKLFGQKRVRVRGHPEGTTLVAKYERPQKSIISLEQCDSCAVEDVTLVIRGAPVENYVHCANVVVPDRTQVPTTSNNKFLRVDCIWDGMTPTTADHGFFFDSTALDQNNDLHTVEDCLVTGAEVAAVNLHGTQIHGLKFLDNRFANYSNSKLAVMYRSHVGAFFKAYNTRGGMYVADFEFGRGPNSVIIEEHNSENSRQLIRMVAFPGTSFPVTVKNCRFSGEAGHSELPLIDAFGLGPYEITGNQFYSATDVAPLIRLRCYSEIVEGVFQAQHGVANIHGNVFMWSNEFDNGHANIAIPSTWSREGIFGNNAHIEYPGKAKYRAPKVLDSQTHFKVLV